MESLIRNRYVKYFQVYYEVTSEGYEWPPATCQGYSANWGGGEGRWEVRSSLRLTNIPPRLRRSNSTADRFVS